MSREAQLKAKIDAVNKVNALRNQFLPMLINVVTPFVGQQIIKVDGELTAKFKKVLPPFPNNNSEMIYRSRSDYSLCFNAKTSCCCEGIWVYHEAGMYVAHLQDGIITSMYEVNETYKTDYKLEEILELRKVCEAKRKAYDNARSALGEFGE